MSSGASLMDTTFTVELLLNPIRYTNVTTML